MTLSYLEKQQILEKIKSLDQFGKQQLFKHVKNKYPDTKFNKNKSGVLFAVDDSILLNIKDVVEFMHSNQIESFDKLDKERKETEKEYINYKETDDSSSIVHRKEVRNLQTLLKDPKVAVLYKVAKVLVKDIKKETKTPEIAQFKKSNKIVKMFKKKISKEKPKKQKKVKVTKKPKFNQELDIEEIRDNNNEDIENDNYSDEENDNYSDEEVNDNTDDEEIEIESEDSGSDIDQDSSSETEEFESDADSENSKDMSKTFPTQSLKKEEYPKF